MIEGANYQSLTYIESDLENVILDVQVTCYLYNRETYLANKGPAMRVSDLRLVLAYNWSNPVEKSKVLSAREQRQGQFKLASPEYEWVAESFIRRYCPDNLTTPQALDYLALVDKMNLKLEENDQLDVLGRVYLKANSQDQVEAGTIIINKSHQVHNLQGVLANTVVHECLHWYLHRWLDDDLEDSSHDFDEVSHAYIENQASYITLKVLLPKTSFIQKVQEVITQEKQLNPQADDLEIMEKIVDLLKDFFAVSRSAIKNRLVDLGYDSARGVYEWIDDGYVPAHSWKTGFLAPNQTFCISRQNLEQLKQSDDNLRQALDSGRLVYVESHLCQNHPDFIKLKEHQASLTLTLTDYARRHMDKACLVLTKTYPTQMGRGSWTSFNRPTFADRVIVEVNWSCFKEYDFEELNQVQKGLPRSLGKAIKYLLDEFDVTQENLSLSIGLSNTSLSKIINGHQKPKLGTLIAICIELKLPYTISKELISLASYSLSGNYQLDIIYEQFLQYTGASDMTVERCNKFLEENKFAPLTTGEII